MNNFNKKLLTIGCLQTMGMAIYHFFLPFQFQWTKFLPEGLPTINWALIGLNNYFSFNLLVVSFFLFYHLKTKSDKIHTIKVLSMITICFWCFSAIYQIIKPMPLPIHLDWLGLVLPGIAILNVFLFLIPLKGIMKGE